MWCFVCFVLSTILLQVYSIDCDSVHKVSWQLSGSYGGASYVNLDKTAVVLHDQPFCIVLENYPASTNQVGSSCRNTFSRDGYKKFSVSFESRNTDDINTLMIKVEKAENEMSTEWLCTIWKTNTSGEIKFKIHIKGREKVNLAIGGRHLNYILTNLSELDYDGVYKYEYLDGQVIDMVCTAYWASDDNYLQLKYYNAKHTKLLETNKIKSDKTVNFRKTMKEEYENDYVDCVYIATKNGGIEYGYRIIFKYKASTISNPFKISINNSSLIPAQDSEGEKYQYRFYDGETLSITCEIDTNIHGSLNLALNNLERNKDSIIGSEEVPGKSTIILKTKSDLNKQVVRCNAEHLTNHSAYVSLLLEEYDPLILGLSANDIIQQYSRNFATWIIDYWYTPGQILNLTCVARHAKKIYHWKFRDSFEGSSPDTGPHSNKSFTLKKQDNGTSISCDITSGLSIINLYLKPESSDDIFQALTRNVDRDLLIIIGCALIVSAVITTVGLIIYCRMRKEKNVRQESSETLTRKAESPIPAFPSQWSDASGRYTQEAEMRTNSLYDTSSAPVYARPQKKSKLTPEPLYHTIDPVYNVPLIEGNSGHIAENNYISPVGTNKKMTNKNDRKGREYAQLQRCKKDETYEYIINSNTTTSEYAEPVYCEIP